MSTIADERLYKTDRSAENVSRKSDYNGVAGGEAEQSESDIIGN